MIKTQNTPRLSAAKFRANIIITGSEAYHGRSRRGAKIGFYEYDIIDRQSRVKDNELKEKSHKQYDDKWNKIIHDYRTEGGPG
ncbi:putative mosc domain-containing protein, partial [Erysiphe neolycopersici]